MFAWHTFVLTLVCWKCCHGYELTIVHCNDVHAHYEQINVNSGECSDEQAAEQKCYGGEARRVTFIKDARARYPNTLVLSAGDWFTGTLWFNQYKGQAASTFVNLENYDAMCLGNHEFDLGVTGLAPYLTNLTVPVVDANIDVSGEPLLQNKFNSTIIKRVGGVDIGIIGLTTKETTHISIAGPTVVFKDDIATAREEVRKLKEKGIKLIMVLSHSGYIVDQQMAREVVGIDVIVGGHSHTFLYDQDLPMPSVEESEGPYPTIVQANGRTTLVVQAYAWGKYMGFLNVTFDDNLEVKSWSGRPVLLDHTIAQDNDTLTLINAMSKPLEDLKKQIKGRTVVKLEGDPVQCRLRECNSGNMLTDAMVEFHVDKRESNDTWALASIALLSGGGIRASTSPGPISMGQALTIWPFSNMVDMIKIKGVHLLQAFEHSVANYDIHQRPGAFFQMSGAHVVYDLSKPAGSRVIALELLCLNCTVPKYEPLDKNAIYNVIMMDFTINGGDNFQVITDNLVEHVKINTPDIDLLVWYLQKHNPVYADTEGRIGFLLPGGDTSTSVRALPALSLWLVAITGYFMLKH